MRDAEVVDDDTDVRAGTGQVGQLVEFIVMFGRGLGIAVLMDAFVIRGTLVPAFMKLAGEANWWAPGPLRRFHDRFGVSEGDHVAETDSTTGDASAQRPELVDV